jgi:AraC-like DNA-binding protein
LIVNSDRPVDLDISSSRKVTGFCIHLEKNWLQQCFAQLNYSESLLLDHPFHVSHIPDFDEILYSVKENHLGKYLQKLSSHFDLQSYTLPYEEEEVYYNLAYQLLSLQNSFKKEDRELCLLKSSTKKELLKRLSIAKQIIETQKGETLQVDYIAKQSLLSESHLFRSFKKVYGISPYQYFLKIRLSHAAGLLRMQKKTITEVALESGYPDLASFSKSFKKAYQYSPFEYMKQVRD